MSLSSLGIASVTNQHDSLRAAVVLDGVPVGALGFVASREPAFTDASAVSLSFTNPLSGVYVVTLPSPDLWYVFATDAGLPGTNNLPVWIGGSDGDFLGEIGLTIRDILVRHQAAIEARVQTIQPCFKIQQIVYGGPFDIDAWPAVLVQRPSYTSDWYAMPVTKLYHLRLEILLTLVRETEASELPQIARMMSGVVSILSRREEIVLPSGVHVCRCQAEEGAATEERLGDTAHWVAMAKLNWSGDVMRMEGG